MDVQRIVSFGQRNEDFRQGYDLGRRHARRTWFLWGAIAAFMLELLHFGTLLLMGSR